jgi:hypothetical protein
MGTFTGTTIPDDSTVKESLQALETAHESHVSTVATEQGVQDGRLDAIETLNTTQDGRLDGIDADQVTQDNRLTALENADITTDQRVSDLITLSGMPANSTDNGTFTNSIIQANSTTKAALQQLEQAIADLPVTLQATPYVYLSNNTTTPATGRISFDTNTFASVTTVYLNKINNANKDLSNVIPELTAAGMVLYIQLDPSAASWVSFDMSADAVLVGDVFQFAVSYRDSGGGTFANNAKLSFGIVATPGGGGGGGGIPEAPTDGNSYVRQNAGWTDLSTLNNWTRTGTTLSPATAGDDVDLGTGDLSAATGVFSGALTASNAGAGLFAVGADGGLRVQRDGGGATIQVQAANIAGQDEGSIGFLNSANTQFYSYIGTGRSLAAGYGDYTLAFRTESTLGDFSFFTGGAGGSERMRIVGSTGDVYIGGLPSSPNITLNANGSANFTSQISVNGINGRQGGGGTLSSNYYNFFWTGSAMQMWVDQVNLGDVNYTSDYRVKRNVTPLADGAIDRVKQLKPVSFQWKDYEIIRESDQVLEGFIAHEVQEVIPSGASGEKDKERQLQSLRLDGIVSVLTKALQESITRIEALEAEVQALKDQSAS